MICDLLAGKSVAIAFLPYIRWHTLRFSNHKGRRMKKILVAVCVVMAGCANLQTKVTSTSPRTVVVQSFKGMQEAQNAANIECAKYGRTARWAAGDINYIFDCVN